MKSSVKKARHRVATMNVFDDLELKQIDLVGLSSILLLQEKASSFFGPQFSGSAPAYNSNG